MLGASAQAVALVSYANIFPFAAPPTLTSVKSFSVDAPPPPPPTVSIATPPTVAPSPTYNFLVSVV